MNSQLKVITTAVDVLAQFAIGIGLSNCSLHTTQDVRHFAADVNEGVVRANRVRADDDALNQNVRVGHHQRDVFARTWLGLVGVDDEVVRLVVTLWDEAPLHAGGKSCATATAKT
ncbi:unannotated protein [freshwater metagenome]|uniref:Unannotated protein n=1 Tax=freshwater metagenome TaxID=449393 RepID=A0A6J6W5Z1_9ZZZZ